MTRPVWYYVPQIGFSAEKIIFLVYGEAHLLAMFTAPLVTSVVKDPNEIYPDKVRAILGKISKDETIVWCKGITSENLHGNISNARETTFPCKDIRSKNCPGMFVAGNTVPVASLQTGIWVCTECSQVAWHQKRKIQSAEMYPANH